MSRPVVEGHIHGTPVIIVRARDEAQTRGLREFVPLDAYQEDNPPVHEYEIGALFEDGGISRRIIVRRMDRRAVFTDEQLAQSMGAEAAKAFLERERRRQSRRTSIVRAARRRMVVPMPNSATCDACGLIRPLTWDGRGHYVCSRCTTILNLAGDCPEMLRKLAGFIERMLPRAKA